MDSLFNQLRQAGELDSEGEFTLDLEQARRKFQQFGLREPRRYVLQVVAAAVLHGATRVRFSTDHDCVTAEWDGPPLENLPRLIARLFSHTHPVDRELAIAATAALEAGATRVELESAGQALVLSECEARVEERPTSHTVFRATRPDGRWLSRLVSDVTERKLLRECALYSPIPIELDGEPINRPLPAHDYSLELRGATLSVHFGEVRLVVNGVMLSRPLLEHGPLSGVVVCRGLELDLTREAPVENDELQAVRELVEEGRARLLERVAEEYPRMQPMQQRAVLPFLIDGVGRAVKHDHGLPAMIARAAVLERADGRPVDFLSVVESYRDQGFLYVTYHAWPSLPPEAPLVVRADHPEHKVRELFSRVIAADSLLEQLIRRNRNRKRWTAIRATTPRLRFGRYLWRKPLTEIEGEVGMLATPGCTEAVLQLYREGRPLGYLALPAGRLPGGLVVAANHKALEGNADWSGVLSDAAVEKVIEAALRAL